MRVGRLAACVAAVMAVAGSSLLLLFGQSSAIALGVPEAPPNDNFLYPVNLNTPGQPLNTSGPFASKVDTTNATLQSSVLSPCGQFLCRSGPQEQSTCQGVPYGKTVWYDFHPDHDGQVEIRTYGFPNVIALYTYDPNSLVPTEVQCEKGSRYPTNDLFADVDQGTDYTVQIGGRGTNGGLLRVLFNYAYRTHLTVPTFYTQALLQGLLGQPGLARLLAFRFIGLARGETVSYACAVCGPGAVSRGVRQGNTVRLSSASIPIISPRTRLIVGVTSPAHIGRFKIYAFNAVSNRISIVAQGCLAPGVRTVSPPSALHTSLLGQTQCPVPPLINQIGAEYVFWRNDTGHLWEQRFSGRVWTKPDHVPVGKIASPPVIAVQSDGEQDVFWRGTNGHLWEAWYTGKWNGPADLGGGQLDSQPAVGVDSAGDEYVFWKGSDGGLWEKVFSNGGWSLPQELNMGELGSAPAVAVHADGEQDVFWKGTNGNLREAYYNGNWNGPIDLGGGALGSAPSAAVDSAGNEYVVWQGTDQGLWGQSYSGGRWSQAQPLNGGKLGSAPAVAVHADGEQDVFWTGADGDLWETWFNGRWQGPLNLHTKISSPPTVGVDAAGRQAGG